MRESVPGVALALLTITVLAVPAAGQGEDLTEDETLAVQRTMAGNWAWGADRTLEDTRVLQEETLPTLQETLDQQKAVLDALQAQLAAAEQDQQQVEAQASTAGAVGGIPSWLGAAAAAMAGMALGAVGMRMHAQRGPPPQKPS